MIALRRWAPAALSAALGRIACSIACGIACAIVFSMACSSQIRTADFRGLDGTPKPSAGPAFAVRWTLPLMGELGERYIPVEQASPAVDPRSGRVYVGSTRGALLALDADDGRKLYAVRAGSAIEAQPAVDSERDEVYAVSVRGSVLAMRGEDGALRWKGDVQASVSQSPLLSSDAVYVVTDDDTLFAFARKDGAVLFRYTRERVESFAVAGHAGLALANGTLVTGFGDGTIAALDASDGRVRWELDTAADVEEGDPSRRFIDVDTTPAIAGDVVYAASFSSGLYGIDLASGELRFHDPSLHAITALRATKDALIVSSAERGVICLDLPDLRPRWQYVPHRGAVAQPTSSTGASTSPNRSVRWWAFLWPMAGRSGASRLGTASPRPRSSTSTAGSRFRTPEPCTRSSTKGRRASTRRPRAQRGFVTRRARAQTHPAQPPL